MNVQKAFVSLIVGVVAGALAFVIGTVAHLGLVIELDVAIGVIAGGAFYVWG